VPSSKKGPASRPKSTNTSNPRLTGSASAGTAAKGAASKPLSTPSSSTKPSTAKAPVAAKTPASGGAKIAASGKKPPVAVTRRQARLARQAQLQRQRQIITASIIAVVVIAVALIGFQFLPKSKPAAAKPKACAVVPSGTPSSGNTAPTITATPKALSGGLQYIDLRVGCGATVQTNATVTVNYTGWLQNGAKFDSSFNAGRGPFQADLDPNAPNGSVIAGWQQGIVGMKVGGVRRLIIPPALGYGAAGSPPTIPANATLVFDISLISIP
jgi:FKBP-type peptidyl-prolyl cis-trans isomerase